MAENHRGSEQGRDPGVDATLARFGGLSYIEIPATDIRRSATFYEGVLGWELEWRGADDPRFKDRTGHLIGRWMTGHTTAREPGLLPYFYVDRVDDAVAKAIALGGDVVRPPYPEGNLRVATVRDPAGNVIGLWQGPG
jgi:predicted enzyme related to lactoylglutathione lyase